jgi:hypothetical protein
MRTRDLYGAKDPKTHKTVEPGLAQDLWGAMDDLTLAATKLGSAVFQAKMETIPWPMEDRGKTLQKTLCYRGLSGKWLPYGAESPLYVPKRGPRVAGGVIGATANMVNVRIATDYFEVLIGKKALSTFRKMPLFVRADETLLGADDTITLLVWAGRGSRKVTLRPRKLDPSQRKMLRKLAANALPRERLMKERLRLQKAGDAAEAERLTVEIDALGPFHGTVSLAWVQPEGRKGKWMLSIPWTDNSVVQETSGPLIAGVHLGMLTAVSVAYARLEDGEIQWFKDLYQLPEPAVRAYNRVERERRKRLAFNRNDYGLREGRGRERKLRVVKTIGDKAQRLITEAVRQTAAAVVKGAIRRGASVLAIENLKHWSHDHAMDELPDGTNRERATRRRWYFGWHQGALRQAILEAWERELRQGVEVSARNDSRECSTCGKLWENSGVYRPDGKKAESPEYGRITWNEFVCSCGAKMHADRNAAINVVKRGILELENPTTEGSDDDDSNREP